MHLGKIFEALPRFFRRSAENLEYFEDLRNLRVTLEEGSSVSHLVEDSANRPHVDSSAVDFLAKQDLRGSVPESDYFMSVSLEREAESASETKISYL